MIKVAAIKPRDRMNEVIGWRKELSYETQPKVAAWGLQVCAFVQLAGHEPRMPKADMQVNKELIEVSARVLDAPRINYGMGRSIVPESGNWNLRGNQVSVLLPMTGS